jgi:DNA modification methylase
MNNLSFTTGTIARIGNHIVACGDSRDAAFVQSVLGSEQIKLILTDIPYGVAYVEGRKGITSSKIEHEPIANDHLQSDKEFATFTRAWLEAARPLLERKNAAYVFCSDKMMFAFRDGMLEAGFRFGQLIHWIKSSCTMSRLNYAPQHETILYIWHGVHEFMKSKDKSVIVHPKPAKNRFHPSEKPIPILRRIILNSSRIGDLVYDPFAGSGTLALAAEQTKRRSVSIELVPKYCQIIIDRLEKLTGASAVLLSPTSA